jgi:hypothetical protein
MVIKLSLLPQEVIDEYNLLELAHGRWVYIEIQEVTYGLPKTGILAKELLQQKLAVDGYHHPITPRNIIMAYGNTKLARYRD